MSAPFAVVCTGFHRSGTSLTAKRLQAAGFPLGDHLLPPHPSNPDGHFEDSLVVESNDAWLQRQGTNWLFHDEVRLAVDARLEADIAAYVRARDAGAQAWALKDPRLCLSLPAWERALGERGRFILVIRHWGECAQSLYHRHSREMAYGLLPTAPGANVNFRFWTDPNVAYRAWLASSARLLSFAAAQRQRAVLVSTRAIAELARLEDLVAERLGVPLPHPEPGSQVREELLHRRTTAAILPPPPLWLAREMDAMWDDLLALCEFRGADEEVAWDRRRAPHWLRAGIDERVRGRFPERHGAPALASAAAARDDVGTEVTLLGMLPVAQVNARALAAGRAAFVRRDLDGAERILRAGLQRAASPHPLLLLLGDVASARGDHDAAEANYRASVELKSSEHAQLKLARALMALRRWDDALALLAPIVEANPGQTDARLLRARCLEMSAGPSAALASLGDFSGADAGVRQAQVQLTLAADTREGLRMYEDLVRLRLADRDLVEWLAGACKGIAAPSTWEAFVEAVVRHWSSLLGAPAVHARLGLALPPDASRLPAAAPPVMLAGIEATPARAVAAHLRASGWWLADEPESVPFAEAFADPGLAALAPDHADAHAARVRFLDALAHELDAVEPAPVAFAFQHPDAHWFAAPLLEAVPTLRYVFVHAGPAAAAAGWPLSHRATWAARVAADAVGDTAHAALKYWIAAYRHGLALEERFPGRVLLLDARRDDPAQASRWRALLEDPTLAPPPAQANGAWQTAMPPDATFDPADLQFLRDRGLWPPA